VRPVRARHTVVRERPSFDASSASPSSQVARRSRSPSAVPLTTAILLHVGATHGKGRYMRGPELDWSVHYREGKVGADYGDVCLPVDAAAGSHNAGSAGSSGTHGTLQNGERAPGNENVWRPVQYLGSKLRVVDAISALAREVVPGGAPVADLFAGSTVVSQGLARAGFSVTAVDTQVYSTLFARAMLGIGRADGECLDAELVLEMAAADKHAMDSVWSSHEAREDDAKLGTDARSLRKLYAALPLAWRRGRNVADAEAPLTSFYAGSYFGVRQALHLDSIRLALSRLEGCLPGSWLHAGATTALMHAASMAVHSAGKHFAQPLKARAANATFLDRRLLSDRAFSIPDAFRSACATINQTAPLKDMGHRTIRAEAEAYIGESKASQALYYLDPPYTAQQYSRFYHVLETIATSAMPAMPIGSAPTSGLYPADRYKSAFSSRRQAPKALAQILEGVATKGAIAIVSYSVSARGSNGNARMITLDELLSAGQDVFGVGRVEVIELPHRYRQFNSVENANEGRDDREVLVLCRPV